MRKKPTPAHILNAGQICALTIAVALVAAPVDAAEDKKSQRVAAATCAPRRRIRSARSSACPSNSASTTGPTTAMQTF